MEHKFKVGDKVKVHYLMGNRIGYIQERKSELRYDIRYDEGCIGHDIEENRIVKYNGNQDMEINVGDKVMVSKDAPEMYFFGCNYDNSVCKVILVDRDNAVITQVKNGSFAIPTKYLIKVEDEAKEPKFKVGDVIDTPKGKGTVRISYGDYWVVQLDNGVWYIHTETNMPSAPYTEPTEQTEVEETNPDILKKIAEEWANNVSNAIEEYGDAMCKIYVEAHNEAYWEAYTTDLAHDLALKVANKYNDPAEAADYAVSVAKAVVENLNKK